MLEANPSLRWIDVQDIIARTSARPDPDSPEWQTNGAGLHVMDYLFIQQVLINLFK